jgi:hypothetical protein
MAFSSCVVGLLEVHGVIMNERDFVTYCAPVGLTVDMLGLRECEMKLFIMFIFPRNMLESRVFRESVVWETLLVMNRDRRHFLCITL